MIAGTGWVEDVKPTGILIKLKAGRTFEVPRRINLKWGESVRVFWNEETNRIGHIMTLDELHLLDSPKEFTMPEEYLQYETPSVDEIIAELLR